MPRVPLGSITHYDAPGENTQPPKLLLAVGHPPELADASLNLFRTLVNGALPVRDRKLATLAIAAELENGYEWGHHAGSALTMGITEAELDAIKSGATDALDPHDRVLVRLAVAIERQAVTDELWDAAAAQFGVEQLVQFTVLVSYYGMLGRIQTALQVDQDDGFSGRY